MNDQAQHVGKGDDPDILRAARRFEGVQFLHPAVDLALPLFSLAFFQKQRNRFLAQLLHRHSTINGQVLYLF